MGETPLALLSALLWLAIALVGGAGRWLLALFLLLALLGCYALLGARRAGRVELRLVAFPTLAWLALWATAFAMAERHSDASASLLGFHPSFTWILLCYWLGASLVMAFGFVAIKDRWLPEQRWQAFLAQVREPQDESASHRGDPTRRGDERQRRAEP